MDFERAERHYRELQAQRDRGGLDEGEFRVEVAKLLFRDDQGVFWMLDADEGTWVCNRGESWEPGDPRADGATAAAPFMAKRRRRRRGLALGIALVVLLGLAGATVLQLWPAVAWPPLQPTPTPSIQVEVTIASPADGSQVALDQEVAVEFTIHSAEGLQAADRVDLQVNGETVNTQPVRSKAQPGQTSVPLSQPWLPTTVGEYQIVVVVLSAEGDRLGQATATVSVAEASDEALPEPACTPDATFVADVTIPPGTAFRPDTQIEKVWQVRNSGSCAWGTGYGLIPVQGEELDAPDRVPVPPTAAGESADLAVTLRAPSEAGTYTSTWQLQSPDGTLFGSMLTLNIEVEVQAEESLPPNAPTSLQATVTEDGEAVRLTWQDRSNNEDAFRVYREDVEASIGLAPANAQLFVDKTVTCGKTYRYGVVAFNAAGSSPLSEMAEVSLSPCAPADAPPSLVLTVVPTQAVASETITIAFQATDDLGLAQVTVWGEKTGEPDLDAGRTLTCTGTICAGSWPVTLTTEISTTLTIVAVARDSSGQESVRVQAQVLIPPPE